MRSESDLYCVVTFQDGSIWEEKIKRHWEIHPKTCDLVPTTFFLNEWMPGKDLMRSSEIKKSIKEWLELKEEKYSRIKFYFD